MDLTSLSVKRIEGGEFSGVLVKKRWDVFLTDTYYLETTFLKGNGNPISNLKCRIKCLISSRDNEQWEKSEWIIVGWNESHGRPERLEKVEKVMTENTT